MLGNISTLISTEAEHVEERAYFKSSNVARIHYRKPKQLWFYKIGPLRAAEYFRSIKRIELQDHHDREKIII